MLALTLSLLGLVSRVEPRIHWESHGPSYAFVDAVVAAQDDETIYAAAHDPSSGASGLFRTADGGEHWDMLAQSPPGETIHQVAVDPTDSRRMLALTTLALPFGRSSARLYRSSDGGSSWRLTTTLAETNRDENLFFDPTRPDTAFLRGQSGLFRSIGGDSWVPIAQGSSATSAWITPSGVLFWVGDAQVCLGIPCDPGSPEYGVEGLYSSTDAGQTANGAFFPDERCLPLNVAYAPSDPATAYGSRPSCTDLLRSLDGGYTWESWDPSGEISQALHGSPGRRIAQIAVGPSNPAVVYVLTLAYPNGDAGIVLRSLDAGESWATLPSPDGGVTSMALAPPVNSMQARRPASFGRETPKPYRPVRDSPSPALASPNPIPKP